MTDRYYRAHIFKSSAADLSSGARDFTLGVNRLASPPTIAGSVSRPLYGRTEASPWTVEVVDVGSSFTAQLSDSTGRADLLRRIVQVERSTNNTTWASLGCGRLKDIVLNNDVASYSLSVEDERMLERQTVIFNSSNTTRLFPAGPAVNWGPYSPPPKGGIYVSLRSADTKYAQLQFGNEELYRATDSAIDAIEGDVVDRPLISTAGNFTYARVRVGVTDYPIVSFGGGGHNPGDNYNPGPFTLGDVRAGLENPMPAIWVADPTTSLTAYASYSSAYLHMFGAPPSAGTPLHVGGSAGLHPAQVLKNIYDLTYTTGSAKAPRYSTAAIDTLLAIPMPPVRFRITGQENMAQWLENEIYQPFMIQPFVNSSGVLAPQSIALPGSSTGITFTFSGANLGSQPTWNHTARDQVTVARVHFTAHRWHVPHELRERTDLDGDRIVAGDRVAEVIHDRTSAFGRHELDITAHGIGDIVYPGNEPLNVSQWSKTGVISEYINYVKRDWFDRFGDGPVEGHFAALTTAESVEPGDIVKLTLGTYPNLNTQARGSTRVVQILSKDMTPAGPEFTYLDVGPTFQASTAPTLTLSASADDPKHSITATVGNVHGRFQLQLHNGNFSTTPAADSSQWHNVPTSTDASSGAYAVGRLPSGTKIWGRARNAPPKRLRSAWTVSSAYITSSALAAPTISGTTGVTHKRGSLVWAVGEANYPPEVFGDASTTATFGSSNRWASLRAGATRFTYTGLSTGTTYLVGVRHYDQYGGVSAADSTTLATSTSTLTAPALPGFSIIPSGVA